MQRSTTRTPKGPETCSMCCQAVFNEHHRTRFIKFLDSAGRPVSALCSQLSSALKPDLRLHKTYLHGFVLCVYAFSSS